MNFHILNGDALLDQFPKDIAGTRIVCRECMIEGPVSQSINQEFFHNRAQHLSAYHDYWAYAYTEFKKLNDIQPADQVYLWFEYDLFCQTNLWFMIEYLSELGVSDLRLVLPNPSDIGQWKGFANYDQEGLVKLLSDYNALSTDQINAFRRLWRSFVTGNFQDHNPRLIKPIISCIDQIIQAEILKNSDHQGSPRSIIQMAMDRSNSTNIATIYPMVHDALGIYGYGDLQVKVIMDRLINNQH